MFTWWLPCYFSKTYNCKCYANNIIFETDFLIFFLNLRKKSETQRLNPDWPPFKNSPDIIRRMPKMEMPFQFYFAVDKTSGCSHGHMQTTKCFSKTRTSSPYENVWLANT